MEDGKGYKLPETVPPVGLRCIKLWIPDDDYCLYALAGSVQYLTTWTAWERDQAKRGKEMAMAWWLAWQYTLENGWLNCGDENGEDEDMATTINNYVNCGGCGCNGDNIPTWLPPGGGNPVVITLPTTGDDFPNPPPPVSPVEPPEPYFPDDPIWEDRAAWEAERCRIANWGWRQVDSFFYNMEQADNRAVQMGAIIAVIVANAPAAIIGRLGYVALIEIAEALGILTGIVGGYSAFFQSLIDWWRSHQTEIVCWAYEAFDSESLATQIKTEALNDLVEEWEALPGWTTAIVEAAIGAMSNMILPGTMSLLFNFQPPPYFVPDIDCSLCGATGFNYELRDKDGGLIASHAAFTGQTITVPTGENAPGSGGGSLILLRFYNADMELKNVTGNLTGTTGHVNPTNSNHPFTVMYSINDGAQNVVLIGLNNPIPVPTEIDGYHHFYLHGLNPFSVTFVIDSIEA